MESRVSALQRVETRLSLRSDVREFMVFEGWFWGWKSVDEYSLKAGLGEGLEDVGEGLEASGGSGKNFVDRIGALDPD